MPGSLCCAVGCWHQSWKKTRHRRSRATQNSRKQHKPHEFYIKLNARRVKTEFSSTWCHLWCGHKAKEPDRPLTTRAAPLELSSTKFHVATRALYRAKNKVSTPEQTEEARQPGWKNPYQTWPELIFILQSTPGAADSQHRGEHPEFPQHFTSGGWFFYSSSPSTMPGSPETPLRLTRN